MINKMKENIKKYQILRKKIKANKLF